MESKEIKLTPEQETLREVTAKWLFERYSLASEGYTSRMKGLWGKEAASLLTVQQAAGAKLIVNAEGRFGKCLNIIPLTGGKE